MKTKRTFLKGRRGSAIALVLMSVALLLISGVAMLALGLHRRMMGVRSGAEIAARAAADAGLTKALFALNQRIETNSWDSQNLPLATNEMLPSCEAKFSYAVTGDPNGGFDITSIGQSGRYQKRVDASLRLQGLFSFGILAKESIVLHNGTGVDEYSSDPNTAPQTQVRIATTSTDSDMVVMQGNTGLDPAEQVVVGAEYYFVSMAAPVLPNMGTSISVKGATRTIGPSDSGKYTSITLAAQGGKSGVLEIAGGQVTLHISGNIDIGQGCEIRVKPTGCAVIYLGGNLIIRNDAGIANETNVPANLFLVAAQCNPDQLIELKAKADFCGIVYAPCASVVARSGSDIYGAVVCEDFEMKNGGTMFYDTTLSDVEIGDLGARFVIDRWQE